MFSNRKASRRVHLVGATLILLAAQLATACAITPPPTSPGATHTTGAATTKPTSPGAVEFSVSPAAGPGQIVRFRRLGIEDGLSQSTIQCIAQDSQGFMWFGTQDGLNRYDGYTFKIYRGDSDDETGLSDNYILRCETDQRGVLWVITRDGTLHRYDPETDRFAHYALALVDPFAQLGSEITTLHGDVKGRLWIGTFGDGVVRYDPADDAFTSYRHDPSDPTSLSHRSVNVIYEDSQGEIWVGTEGGLNRYNPADDSFIRYPYRDFPPGGYQYDPPVHTYDPAFQPDNPYALGSPAITALLEDREGQLWVGTRYGGLNQLDHATGQFTAYPYDPAYDAENPNTFSGNSVRALLLDHLGTLWVASAHWNVDQTRTYARLGLDEFDPQMGTITRHPADPDDPCALPHDAAWRLYEDRHGTLWVHTFAGGLEAYDQASRCFVHYGYDPNNEETLSDDGITRFYEGEADGLWIGTEMGGISLLDATWAKFPQYRVTSTSAERLSNASVWAIAPSPGAFDTNGHAQALWISTFAGINYWDRQTGQFTFHEIDPKLPDVLAYAIFEDPQRQVLWLGTNMGLEKAQLPANLTSPPKALSFTRVLTRSSAAAGFVLDVYPAGTDELWIAQYGTALSRFDLATETIVANYQPDPDNPGSLADARIVDIYTGQQGTLWLVTLGGIEHFDPAEGIFTHYPVGQAPSEEKTQGSPQSQPMAERILSLYEDESGRVWLGTDGEGLQRLDPATGHITASYRKAQGLPNDVVYSILPDATGGLWLSTNRGLARFDPQAQTFQPYTSEDGLQSNEFNMGAEFRAPDGELFFGGVQGFNAFYPETVNPSSYAAPVVITDIHLGPPAPAQGTTLPGAVAAGPGNSTLPESSPFATQEIALTYRDRILSFEFAALDYALPERNQYAYLLEGFDSDWNYVGNRRSATYTNLPAGTYAFRVRGTNSDGVWSTDEASLAVTVAPPFWATWWFRGLVGVLVVGAAGAGYRMRIRGIQARSRELETQVIERTRELAAINAISMVVSRSLDLHEILTDALDKTLELLDIEAGGIYLLDERDGMLSLSAQRGLSAGLAAEIDKLQLGEGFSGQVATSGEPLVVPNVSEDPRLTRIAVMEEGLRSLAAVPLHAKGKIRGTLFTVTRGHCEFSARDVQLLTSIAGQIGVAVENSVLYEDTRSRLAQITALQETTAAVASTLELGRLLRLIIEQAATLLQANAGILNLVDWEAGKDRVVAATGSAECLLGQGSPLDGSLSGWVALHRQPVVSINPLRDGRVDRVGLALLEAEQGSPVENTAIVPLIAKDQVIGTLVVLDRQGKYGQFEESDLDLLETFASQAATAIEHARVFEAEQRRAEQFRVISEVGTRITSILAVDELLNQIARLIQEAFDYYHVGIGLVEGDQVAYRVGAGVLWDNAQFVFEPARLKVGVEGITGWVAATGEPALVPDVTRDPRYLWMRNSGTRSELTVPLKVKGNVIGVLDVQSNQLNGFDESDLMVLQSLANQAAIALDNARLYEQARRLAVVEERQRLARELHDSVTQALYGVTLYAEAAGRQLSAGQTGPAEEHLRELRDTSQEALREMRLLIFELRPSILQSEGLVTALRARLEAVEERAGLGIDLIVTGETALPAEIEEELYRIAQEALNNALKHAAAHNVGIRLALDETKITLEIADDGVGFNPANALKGGGLGLDGMYERASRIDGQLTVESQPGTGTRIRVEVPR